jgi:hypothetical protein
MRGGTTAGRRMRARALVAVAKHLHDGGFSACREPSSRATHAHARACALVALDERLRDGLGHAGVARLQPAQQDAARLGLQRQPHVALVQAVAVDADGARRAEVCACQRDLARVGHLNRQHPRALSREGAALLGGRSPDQAHPRALSREGATLLEGRLPDQAPTKPIKNPGRTP